MQKYLSFKKISFALYRYNTFELRRLSSCRAPAGNLYKVISNIFLKRLASSARTADKRRAAGIW